MNWFEKNSHSSIKDAIVNSIGEQGLISVWQKNEESEPVVFLNGKPFLTFTKDAEGTEDINVSELINAKKAIESKKEIKSKKK